MDKRAKILFGVGFLLLALASAAILAVRFLGLFSPLGERGEAPPEGEALPTIEAAAIRQKTFKYIIDVKYPRFVGNEKAVKASTALEGEIQSIVDQFKINANEVTGEIPLELRSELNIDYEVILLNSKLASVQLVGSEYITGVAHPNNYYLTFNYDFDSEKELSFSDLFKEGSNYLKVISDLAIADLKNREADFDWIEAGAGPQAENYQNFTLSEDALIIYFNPYQVAAYAAGGQEVKIPYVDISTILRPEVVAAIRSN